MNSLRIGNGGSQESEQLALRGDLGLLAGLSLCCPAMATQRTAILFPEHHRLWHLGSRQGLG